MTATALVHIVVSVSTASAYAIWLTGLLRLPQRLGYSLWSPLAPVLLLWPYLGIMVTSLFSTAGSQWWDHAVGGSALIFTNFSLIPVLMAGFAIISYQMAVAYLAERKARSAR